MTFSQAVIICLRKYVTFHGRAPRAEYWWFFLFCLLGGLVAGILETLVNALTGESDGPTLLSGAFNLATFLPGLAVGWRRMHDSGRSGLLLLYPVFIIVGINILAGFAGTWSLMPGSDGTPPFEGPGAWVFGLLLLAVAVSPFVVLWWLTRPSDPGTNQYGPNPYEVAS